ncbi:MAG: hypothetical protein IT210_22975 [Armatimonadetes bacterium]|nr:hypothetical protein [Armatimonadota bacterium]
MFHPTGKQVPSESTDQPLTGKILQPPGVSGRKRWSAPSGKLLLALALAALAVWWVYRDEVVYTCMQVGAAVPPIPALAALLLLLGGAYVAARRRGVSARRGYILWVFLLISVAASATTPGVVAFFAHATLPQYLAATQDDMARVARHFPAWYAPPPGEAIRQLYEGNPDGPIPWGVWLLPLLNWFVLIFLLMLTIYAILALFRQCWMEHERLSYPIVQIPLRIVEGGKGGIWRSPLLWAGLAISGGLDALNMLHAFYPAVPAVDISVMISSWFPNRPWNALDPMWISYRPEIFGIAYLMPSDVIFTASLSYILLRLSSVARSALGEDIASTAYDYQELGIGAFLALFALLVWRARVPLGQSFRQALGFQARTAGQNEPMSPRMAWGILLLGPAAMIFLLHQAGLPVWLAAAHLSLLIIVAVVYSRVRAETGATSIALFPFWQQQYMLTNFLGSRLLAGTSDQALTIFASLGGLSRNYYPEVGAYGAEGMSLAARAPFPQRRVTGAVFIGLTLGLILGGYWFIGAAYRYGMNQIAGGTGHGGYSTYLATEQFNGLIRTFSSPEGPKPGLIFQTLLGSGIVLIFSALRQRFFWFPLHPLGFAVASAYGGHLWMPFMVVWVFKSIVWRFGGSKGYRRLIPFFLGIVFGRYLFTGIIWGLLGCFGHPVTKTYGIHFS